MGVWGTQQSVIPGECPGKEAGSECVNLIFKDSNEMKNSIGFIAV